MIFRLDGAAVARLGFEEALAETLLRAVAAGTSIDTRMSLPCAPSLCHPATIRRRLARVTGRIGKRLPTITGRFRRFGKTFYFGIEDEWAASE
jgi:hypothetical protein